MNFNVEDVSTEEKEAEKEPWFFNAAADSRRKAGHFAPQGEKAPAFDGLSRLL